MGWFARKAPPDPFAERAAGPNVVFHASGVRIRSSATGLRIPGHNRVSTAVSLHRGSVLVTGDHLAIAYRRFVAVDGRLRLDPHSPAQVSFDAEGVHVVIDIDRALHGVPGKHAGEARVDVLAPIPAEVLERLGARAVATNPAQVAGIARRI